MLGKIIEKSELWSGDHFPVDLVSIEFYGESLPDEDILEGWAFFTKSPEQNNLYVLQGTGLTQDEKESLVNELIEDKYVLVNSSY